MKCPLMLKTWQATETMKQFEPMNCLKEECAWYQDEIKNCIIYQLGMEIGTLTCFVEDIKKKMPKDLAPRG